MTRRELALEILTVIALGILVAEIWVVVVAFGGG